MLDIIYHHSYIMVEREIRRPGVRFLLALRFFLFYLLHCCTLVTKLITDLHSNRPGEESSKRFIDVDVDVA